MRRDPLLQPVTVTLFRDEGRYRDDCAVIINGRSWVIRRGVQVKLPRYVALALQHAENQRRYAQRLCEQYRG